MQKRLVSAGASVACIVSCLPSLVVSAEDVPAVGQSGMFDLIEHFGLSGTVMTDTEYVYIAGSGYHAGSNTSYSLYFLGVGTGEEHTCYYNMWYTNGTVQYYTNSSYWYTVFSDRISAQTSYFYDPSRYASGVAVLTDFYTSDPNTAMEVKQYITNNHTQVVTYRPPSGSTFGQLSGGISGVLNPEPTEPPSDPGFQLPQDWIDGGHTLETGEPSTMPSELDPAAGLEFLETLDVKVDASTESSIGFFWAVVEKFFDAFGNFWFFAFFSMLFAFICWLLGR